MKRTKGRSIKTSKKDLKGKVYRVKTHATIPPKKTFNSDPKKADLKQIPYAAIARKENAASENSTQEILNPLSTMTNKGKITIAPR